ncbi:MAG TPA: SDR family NAD(P)-dependent oxidoreductase [Spirochaetota bacterium]|nr:SDR family NAD(P)-dependent oxidoreductase [Spirochaetota bacterium]HPL17653.1 SDR family NAD(P)-dependent oxidoreductase [Spirochaetota bacterium]HQF10015.1 SDR family NAD(P)-dependent oxidoreductase [Spirochaetota bacterium]HQH98611.1 SDR family NAD(P)-dependent oxidoreductase [Spirochaetota bacterium]HQJ72087.1 SDR family NAD(P)-dependent oxidoreductase [Spirochaetota bacterium]
MNTSVSMKGKTCLITGSTSGHGLAVAEALHAMGADIILHGPTRDACESVRNRFSSLAGTLACDFSSRRDIARGAGEVLSWKRPIHVLVNNAGMVNRKRRLTVDGIEETFAVNYLAMFQFTLQVLHALLDAAPARIVNVGSDAHMLSAIDPDDIDGSGKSYSVMGSYGRSKLGVAYFTQELARRLGGTGVTVNALDPGPMASSIAKKPGILPRIADAVIQLTFPTPARAARTAIYLASSPEVEGMTGKYFRFMKMKDSKLKSGADFHGQLWDISARITGADYRG